jgi:hypothetical protein
MIDCDKFVIKLSSYMIVNCKAVPQQTLEAQRERMYSSYSFTTSALDGGEWSASLHGYALPPGKGPLIPIGQEAGWAPEPVWTQRLEEKYVFPCQGSNPFRPVVQSAARRCNNWATPAPLYDFNKTE